MYSGYVLSAQKYLTEVDSVFFICSPISIEETSEMPTLPVWARTGGLRRINTRGL